MKSLYTILHFFFSGTIETGYWNHQCFCVHAHCIDPQRDLLTIDRLEGFRPGGHSMYKRVLVAVLCGRRSIPAWIYCMPCPPYAEEVASGQLL